ncbi:hypothetical protein PS896_03957 [Pseudomonas fluorescens]|uniref:Uncharacterized protein n=1 Tax=Pseudomonas fluorescens TaxID=294 RepID=A0A5E7MF71_PSEFL|nr:hypothetical protein [Pseudomonas fluorescens]VVP23336.1 hypothetical protein PS896_03957 [Pseudomonas fluorescens]
MAKKLEFWGVLGTVIYLSIIGTTVSFKLDGFLNLELNELGDFLAGAFGPVAFLWLVLGFLQQGRELKLSSDALQLQAQELKNSVDQQRELVEVTRAQVEADLENLKTVRQLRAKEIKPFFVVDGGGGYHSGKEHELDFQIRNLGHAVTRLEFDFGPRLSNLNRSLHVLNKNDSTSFKVKFNDDDEEIDGWLAVEFLNADQEKSTAMFHYKVEPRSATSAYPQLKVQLSAIG